MPRITKEKLIKAIESQEIKVKDGLNNLNNMVRQFINGGYTERRK
jgi:hypothetical protein